MTDFNYGYQNTGDRNLGDGNYGNQNYGNRSNGDGNYGNQNYGNHNYGDRNNGDRNNGEQNNGNWNKTHQAYGCWNTEEPTFKLFNKPAQHKEFNNCTIPQWMYFELLIDKLEWIDINNMTDQQKKDNPTYHINKGFLLLKKSPYSKDEIYQKSAQASWDKATHEDRMLTYKLPNFDFNVAQEIFGIDFKAYLEKYESTKCGNKEIIIDGKKYKLVK